MGSSKGQLNRQPALPLLPLLLLPLPPVQARHGPSQAKAKPEHKPGAAPARTCSTLAAS
jgi:hypothetical protein